jgi:hypothetical protein
MIRWVESPSTPPFICQVVGFIKKILVSYSLPDRDSISTYLFYKNYLLNIS